MGFYEIVQRFPWKANKLDLPERTPQIPDKWPLVLSLKVGARVRCLRNIDGAANIHLTLTNKLRPSDFHHRCNMDHRFGTFTR